MTRRCMTCWGGIRLGRGCVWDRADFSDSFCKLLGTYTRSEEEEVVVVVGKGRHMMVHDGGRRLETVSTREKMS